MSTSALIVALLVCVGTEIAEIYEDANPYNGAPPAGVPKEFDCAWRHAAYVYGKKLQPSMTSAHQQQLSDALQIGACPGGAPAPDSRVTEEQRRTFAIPKGSTPIYVQPATDGLHAALGHARRVGGPVTLSLMPGVHRLTKPLLLSPADSNTTIQSFGGGETVLSGSRSISAGLSWKKYKVPVVLLLVLVLLAAVLLLPSLLLLTPIYVRAR